MSRTSGHVESSRHEDHLHPCVPHLHEKIREPDIKANAHSHLPVFSIKNCSRISGRQHIRFLEILSALDIDIKQMHFAMLADQISTSVENIRSIIDLPIFQFRDRPSDHIHPPVTRQL